MNILFLSAGVLSSLFLVGCSTASFRSPSSAAGGVLQISTNQMNGEPEHIGEVSINIDGFDLPTNSVLNTMDNDAGGNITIPAPFDSDEHAKLILAVDDKASSGHKVLPGLALTLVLGDGSVLPIGTTSGPATDHPSGFGYSESLSLAPGVSLAANTSRGSPVPSYFRNALNVCMEQDTLLIKTTTVLTVNGRSWPKTTQGVENAGREKLAFGKCR